MPQLHVLFDFTHCRDGQLHTRAGNVHTKLYKATVPYPAPPVEAAELQAVSDAYMKSLAATLEGGKQATAHKHAMKAKLIALLRKLALYVEGRHNNDLATLMLSGFDAASTIKVSEPLATPSIVKVAILGEGKVKLHVPAIKRARGYDLRYALLNEESEAGAWTLLDNLLSTRRLIVTGLTPGARYAFQVRALGGSTKHSDWSGMIWAMSM